MKRSASNLILVIVFLCSCTSKTDFDVLRFNPVSNFIQEKDTVVLAMDLSEAVHEGIIIPSKRQDPSGYFKMNFEIINKSNKPQVYYYRIYYQNESYKFNEFIEKLAFREYNELSGNNFYGSWDDTLDFFHKTGIIPGDNKPHIVTDSFRIVGNPRNEAKYFGSQSAYSSLNEEMIQKTIAKIRRNKKWFEQIKDKAAKKNITVDEQLVLDAIWIINDNLQQGDFNNRWKRNPRAGNYSFVLAVTTFDEMEKLPESLKNIGRTDSGIFVNPYYDLLYNNALTKENIISVVKSKTVLKTSAVFDLDSGIYIDPLKSTESSIDTSYYSEYCGSSYNLFNRAQFEQYFHTVDKGLKLSNIPLAFDVTGNNYTQDDYNKNASLYKPDDRIAESIQITNLPGKTVCSDTKSKSIIIKNPGIDHGEFRKENVGINTRIGFTYGKFIAKIQFPPVINDANVWNGLTCAYWLKFQEDRDWNYRSACDGSGYLSKAIDGPESPRLKTTFYSEIDFEILKTSEYWPPSSYQDKSNIPQDRPGSNHDIIVACTNWDMACKSPENFNIGAQNFKAGGKNYTVHRWDDWYKALTIKTAVEHDSLFNRPCYYEIDWQPDKIIWRIGTDRNNMTEIGSMDHTITTIPDNQMIAVFTQEFHHSDWWPLSPFIQDLIPFPKNDIIGRILELKVE